LKKKGWGASEIAKALKIGRASVYRALEDDPKSPKAKAFGNAVNRGDRFVWGPEDVEHH
jgi:hypothetical protein